MLLLLLIILLPLVGIAVMFWIGFQSDKNSKKHPSEPNPRNDYDRQELEIRAHAGDGMARMLLAERFGEWDAPENT